jgi:hypothetical protein
MNTAAQLFRISLGSSHFPARRRYGGWPVFASADKSTDSVIEWLLFDRIVALGVDVTTPACVEFPCWCGIISDIATHKPSHTHQ